MIDLLSKDDDMTAQNVRTIAFYLPQYHPIPENDEWWGKGFTEWTNVTQARPLFPGHYQPHLPADLGFYDLRLPGVREAQAKLAREYGIHGFCYYHYWFNGRRVLEQPFNEVLASGKPDFPFCLCWANENWTRVWDGGDRDILLEQKYSPEDDREHIRSLIPALQDKRYIRINQKPLLLIYRTELLPNPSETAKIWREEAKRAGIDDIYLARVEHFTNDVDPRNIGFDAAVEFAPDGVNVGKLLFRGRFYDPLTRFGLLPRSYLENNVINYSAMIEGMLRRHDSDFMRFRCVTPAWDNSARRKKGARIYVNSTPEKYQKWLTEVIRKTSDNNSEEERIVFINAWNEWAEGSHLEPDLKYGRAYLEATRNALKHASSTSNINNEIIFEKSNKTTASMFKKIYWRVLRFFEDQAEMFRNLVRRS